MRRYGLFCCLVLFPLLAMAEPPWLVIDTQRGSVTVYQDTQVMLHLTGAAFGQGGTTDLHLRGDRRTPLGVFHIIGINRNSRFHIFFELDYPTTAKARLAYQRGLIQARDLQRIRQASMLQLLPPQDTSLGGEIGIHGIGNGSAWIHRHFNWTDGCIALTNLQIDKLSPWLEIGTRVVIQ